MGKHTTALGGFNDTRGGAETFRSLQMADAQQRLQRSNQKKIHHQSKKMVNRNKAPPGFFVSPQYPSSLSESLKEDNQSLKINALLSTAGKKSVDPDDENNPSDVRAPTYIPDPRKCVISPDFRLAY